MPSSFVTVTATMDKLKLVTTTNDDGIYIFDLPDKGKWVFQAEMFGFATAHEELTLVGAASVLDFDLELQAGRGRRCAGDRAGGRISDGRREGGRGTSGSGEADRSRQRTAGGRGIDGRVRYQRGVSGQRQFDGRVAIGAAAEFLRPVGPGTIAAQKREEVQGFRSGAGRQARQEGSQKGEKEEEKRRGRYGEQLRRHQAGEPDSRQRPVYVPRFSLRRETVLAQRAAVRQTRLPTEPHRRVGGRSPALSSAEHLLLELRSGAQRGALREFRLRSFAQAAPGQFLPPHDPGDAGAVRSDQP